MDRSLVTFPFAPPAPPRPSCRPAGWGLLPTWRVLAFGLALACASWAAPASEYVITDLGSGVRAHAVNDNGQVAGWMYVNGMRPGDHAFRTDTAGAKVDLGTLGGGRRSWAADNNAAGVVVGAAFQVGDDQTIPFRTDASGAMVPMAVGAFGGTDGAALGVNGRGEITGWADTANDEGLAFRADAAGVITPLGTLGGGYSAGFGINDLGQVVGESDLPGNLSIHAFRTDAAGVMRDLGTLGGSQSIAYQINNRGQAVGRARTAGDAAYHAFLADVDGTMTDLGTLGGTYSAALGINEAGLIVGDVYTPGANLAFLYRDGAMIDLNTLIPADSGWKLEAAYDVNNRGQIVGLGYFARDYHAFLLTPVPEPASCAAITAAAGAALLRRRRSGARRGV